MPSEDDKSNAPLVIDEAPLPSDPDDLEVALKDLFERLDVSEDPSARAVLMQIRTMRTYRGPIPPPEMLSEYNKVVPGLAETIIDRWGKQQAHRHELEAQTVHGDEKRMDVAQGNAFWVAIVGIVLAAIIALVGGSPWIAAVIAIVSVGGPNAATVLSRFWPGPRE